MRWASFSRQGRISYGFGSGAGLIEVGGRADAPPSLRAAIAEGRLVDLVDRHGGREVIALDELTFLPPIPDPTKLLCVGLNYRRHAEELSLAIPGNPAMFIRFTDSVIGHGGKVLRPRVTEQFDFEGELAVIIGKPARYVSREEALGFVAGYACFADNSARDYQRHSFQVTAGKNFPQSGACGPWLVTADEVGDPAQLMLTTRLNGTVVQHETVADMIFSVAEIVAYVSSMTALNPGDVIATGTPHGVGLGRMPPLFMVGGDRLEVEISKLGTLAVEVVDEPRSAPVKP